MGPPSDLKPLRLLPPPPAPSFGPSTPTQQHYSTVQNPTIHTQIRIPNQPGCTISFLFSGSFGHAGLFLHGEGFSPVFSSSRYYNLGRDQSRISTVAAVAFCFFSLSEIPLSLARACRRQKWVCRRPWSDANVIQSTKRCSHEASSWMERITRSRKQQQQQATAGGNHRLVCLAWQRCTGT